jgi:putative salt-induced outer membrane protein YdiY
VYTHENFAGQSAGSSAEGVLGGMLDFFTPRSDNFSFSNALVSFYNLGGRARARVELESALRYEFYKDFYWAVNGFESFDSTPPENQKRNDAGVSLTLGWKF